MRNDDTNACAAQNAAKEAFADAKILTEAKHPMATQIDALAAACLAAAQIASDGDRADDREQAGQLADELAFFLEMLAADVKRARG